MLRAALPAAVLALIASSGLHEAHAQTRTRVGVLTCNVSGGIGLIVTSQKTTVCTFDPRGGRIEDYVGVIRRFGLDVGVTGQGVLAWAVFAAGSVAPGALAGSYVGATAEASLGPGIEANVLVGGFNRSIVLQPLSIGGQTGVNFALGVGDFELRAAP